MESANYLMPPPPFTKSQASFSLKKKVFQPLTALSLGNVENRRFDAFLSLFARVARFNRFNGYSVQADKLAAKAILLQSSFHS